MASSADVIARRLHQAGCRHAFGIPGGEVLRLVKGLTDNGISFGLAKHENAAGFMAEGTYHANGLPEFWWRPWVRAWPMPSTWWLMLTRTGCR